MESWFAEAGVVFLQGLGIAKGHYVLDFGCGEGYYTIPAAIIVEPQGKVYAFDKDETVLTALARRAKKLALHNIVLMPSKTDLQIDLTNEWVDVALLYDVLHYIQERGNLYQEIWRVLKPNGFLSVYPKHCKSDFPMWHLADLELEEVIKEIEAANFRFEHQARKQLVHFRTYTQGYILRFRK